MKIRDLDKGRYIVVYDMGKSEYSEGMAVVGQVVELIFNDEDDNAAIIQSMPFQRYTVTDDNYFDYWNDYMESKTERVGEDSIPKPGQKHYFNIKDFGPHNLYKINNQSNDVQQRKRNDMVNSPSHYNYGEIEVIDFIEQVTKHYNPNVAYHIGNAIKYLARSPHKNGKEDVEKARWYIERAFENWDVK